MTLHHTIFSSLQHLCRPGTILKFSKPSLRPIFAMQSPSATAGQKRKRPDEAKYYAVKVGAEPGIYRTYADCIKQVNGFKGGLFKTFPTEADAQSFMQHGQTGSGRQKFYAVRHGHIPGVYTDWPACQAQIKGFKGAKQKGFQTRAEAEAYVKGDDGAGEPDGNSKSKKVRKSDFSTSNGEPDENLAAGEGPMPEGTVDEFDTRIVLNAESGSIQYKTSEQRDELKMLPVGVSAGQKLRIYTDGSSLKNGQMGAQAGVGVYFGPKDARNVSEALSGSRQTNQRAELTAVKRAIELAPRDREIVIITDSKYAISCCTEWFQNWRRNGWQTSDKKPVENRDLVEPIIHSIEQRQRLKTKTTFEWVKGHASDPGNIAADELAVAGARNPLST